MSRIEHWDDVYRRRSPDAVSWYAPRLERSLALIDRCALASQAHIVDVGGGASTLVDDLLARGFQDLTVADLSKEALAHSRSRLGAAASAVRWIVGDATTPLFAPDSVDLWHDRAVFHFLTEAAQREAYVAALRGALRPGGFAIIATFGPNGPERCSGLPVTRYAAKEIVAALGGDFVLLEEADEVHSTPSSASQAFAYALCQKRPT